MLVLSRRVNEAIELKHNGTVIRIVVVRISHDKVRLGIEADKNVSVMRTELLPNLRDLADSTSDPQE